MIGIMINIVKGMFGLGQKPCVSLPGDPKKYSCLIKGKMRNQREIFKIKIFLNYQCADLNFDILVLIFACNLAEI